jgi:universal stress protein A
MAPPLHAGATGQEVYGTMVEAHSQRGQRRQADRAAAFSHIVVPTDLTDRTTRALDLAVRLAGGPRPRVTLVHVIQSVPGLKFGELKPFYEQLRRKAEKKLLALARQASARGVDVSVEIVYGPRAETIVKTATAREADLIMLASHRVNPSAVDRDWGTISHRVGLLAQCPVLLVK